MKVSFIPLIPVLALMWCSTYGQTISSVSGSVSGDESVVMSSSLSDFGTKSPAAPILWEPFNTGANGDTLDVAMPDWSHEGTYDAYCVVGGVTGNQRIGATISSTQYHSGGLSVMNSTERCGFDTNSFLFSDRHTSEIFVSYWWRTDNADLGSDAGLIKLSRVGSVSEAAGGMGNNYNGAGTFGISGMMPAASADPYFLYNYDDVEVNMGTSPGHYCDIPWNEWCRIDTYSLVGTADTADGNMSWWITAESGNDSFENDGIVTMTEGKEYTYDSFLLGLMYANNDESGDFELYLDDLYIDDTLSRVEIGNNSVFEDCTHREIQIPTAWAADEITVTVNQGSFAAADTAYLFVVDADGAVSDGYQVVIGVTAGSTITAPTNLQSSTAHQGQ